MKYFLFVLISFTTLAQNSAIKIEIDSITSLDSIPTERKFTINYHIENLTDNEVSFFLNPNSLVSNSRASMSRFVSYKIYQNKESIDIENIFGRRKNVLFLENLKNAKTEEEKRILIENHLKELKIDVASDIKNAKEDNNYFWKKENQNLLSDIIILNPKQKKIFSKTLFWDKKRYRKIDDIEYYLDEMITHYFELSINLMKQEYKDKLSDDDYQQIMSNPNFIKGWYTSNRIEINFKK